MVSVTEHHIERRPAPRWHRRRPYTYAALDLGTNNCRLLIARPAGDAFRVIDAFSRIVRLGEGVGTTGRLSPAAMARTIDALRICATKMRRRDVTHARCVATEACRRARNTADFLERVRHETDLMLEVIDPREEATLATIGCTPLFDDDADHGVLFDIGGGSTQLIWLRLTRRDGCPHAEAIGATSLPCGVVTLAERFGGDRFTPASYAAMCDHVTALLEPFDCTHGIAAAVAAGRAQMVGTSGTVTTLAGVLLDLPRYDRARVDGVSLTFADIGAVSRRLAGLDCAGRAAYPCIGPERADLVVAGCAVLEAICTAWPVGRLRVADRGLRDGMLHSIMRADGAGRVAAAR